jgi:hypothetical protein
MREYPRSQSSQWNVRSAFRADSVFGAGFAIVLVLRRSTLGGGSEWEAESP